MKYKLLNEFGNRVIYTDNEREKNSLIEKGFHIAEEQKTKEIIETEKKPKTKKKVETNNEGNANN